jgi:endonuclease III
MSNRAAKYEVLYKSLKKHYKPIPEPGERTVLEHLVYACCLEDARYEQADEAFAKLQQAYFDWNEVRVTTVIELGEALGSLPNPTQAGHRIKRCLQSLFEARYQYDIEDMKKANLGKATEELTAWKGVTPFVLAYVSQNALGGHFIPADTMTLDTLVQADIMTESEAEKKVLPGVERAITKTKGTEFSSLLHQFAVEFQHNQKNATALLVFKDLGVTPKAKPKAASLPEKLKPSKADSAEPTASSSKSIPAETQAIPSKKSDKSKAADPVVVAKKEELKKPATKATPSKVEAIKPAAGKVVAEAPAKPAKPKKSELNKAELKPAVKNPTTKEVAPGKEKAVKKSESKSVPKAAADAGSAKSKPEAKKSTEVKKPAKPVAPKAKAAPAKPSPTKASSKEATNVKITKKKPR